jgi:phosphoglucosamine mutase
MAPTKDGIVKDGDDIIALLAQHPRYASESTIIGTITTNQGLEEHITNKGKQFIRTSVGDAWVKSALTEHSACLGGEPSGHIIVRDITSGSDALVTTLLLIETAQKTDNMGFSTFKKHAQKKLSIPISQQLDLEHGPAQDMIKKYQTQLSSGRIIVRYSGTEPVLRICIESKHDQEINDMWHSLYDDFLQLHTGL